MISLRNVTVAFTTTIIACDTTSPSPQTAFYGATYQRVLALKSNFRFLSYSIHLLSLFFMHWRLPNIENCDSMLAFLYLCHGTGLRSQWFEAVAYLRVGRPRPEAIHELVQGQAWAHAHQGRCCVCVWGGVIKQVQRGISFKSFIVFAFGFELYGRERLFGSPL